MELSKWRGFSLGFFRNFELHSKWGYASEVISSNHGATKSHNVDTFNVHCIQKAKENVSSKEAEILDTSSKDEHNKLLTYYMDGEVESSKYTWIYLK